MHVVLSLDYFFALIGPASCALVNVTIDDTFGDEFFGTLVTYTPPTQWQSGQSCNSCMAQPDARQAFDGTWTESDFVPAMDGTTLVPKNNATVSFNGACIHLQASIVTARLSG